MKRIGRVTATTIVDADPATAFVAFTAEVNVWWKDGPRFRPSIHGRGVLHFEPSVGGRLLETYSNGSSFEFGRVKQWEPGQFLVFELFARSFAPGESTEVEVRFQAEGHGTRVTVTHHGWERFPDDHRVKHGLGDAAFANIMSVWWADLLVSLQSHCSEQTTPKAP